MTSRIPRGMLIVYTGDGKGKTTAALGLGIRAIGSGLNVAMLQFIKTEEWDTGERRFFHRYLPETKFYTIGAGFSWLKPRHFPTHAEAAQEAWRVAKQLLEDEKIDMVILDELNVALKLGYLNVRDVCETLRNFKDTKYIVITGRGAHPKIIELADLVTEMRKLRHPYDSGMPAVKGIDY